MGPRECRRSGRKPLAVGIANGLLTTVVGGISVTINGKNAFVGFISQQQINVQAPDDSAQAPVSVVVTNHRAVSAPFTAQLQAHGDRFVSLGAPPTMPW